MNPIKLPLNEIDPEVYKDSGDKSERCIEGYVQCSSTLVSGMKHKVTFDLYARRIDWNSPTNARYIGPSGGGWDKTWAATGTDLVFKNKTTIHLATWTINVMSDKSGVATFNAKFAAQFTSGSGLRRMTRNISTLQLDKPKLSVTINSPRGISCSVSKNKPCVGDTITVSVDITNTAKYGGYTLEVTGATPQGGNSYKVTDDVIITVVPELAKYGIHITTDSGVSIDVSDSYGSSLSNGSKVEYGTILSISVKVKLGYELVDFYVNNQLYGENDVVTINPVEAEVYASARSRESGVVYIEDGSGMNRYQVYIYTDTGWDLYKPYLYTDTGWGICG